MPTSSTSSRPMPSTLATTGPIAALATRPAETALGEPMVRPTAISSKVTGPTVLSRGITNSNATPPLIVRPVRRPTRRRGRTMPWAPEQLADEVAHPIPARPRRRGPPRGWTGRGRAPGRWGSRRRRRRRRGRGSARWKPSAAPSATARPVRRRTPSRARPTPGRRSADGGASREELDRRARRRITAPIDDASVFGQGPVSSSTSTARGLQQWPRGPVGDDEAGDWRPRLGRHGDEIDRHDGDGVQLRHVSPVAAGAQPAG